METTLRLQPGYSLSLGAITLFTGKDNTPVQTLEDALDYVDVWRLIHPWARQHPSEQVRLAIAQAKHVANSGNQAVFWSFSVNVLNGLRLAVQQRILAPEQVIFHHLTMDDGDLKVVSPVIDLDGCMSEWPDGFFDTYGKTIDAILVGRME